MELLAPAGNLEAAVAAFHYGADAVYLGLHDFSARADADNFDFDDLATIVGLAHEHSEWPRKVYVTVNTLIRQAELPRLIDLLARLRDLEVDGLIVQDWGVYQLVRKHFPEFELHASTQLAIHNEAGARRAQELGFSRIVLARELTMPEIERIAALPKLETEVFIHGALCYSYSGLCLLSAALRGTSGNRGECEYICRSNYVVKQPDGQTVHANIMSMKDLAAGELISSLVKANVTSFKIEGRKKTPLYVAAVTNYYRNLIDGTFEPGEQARVEADIRTIFSRPWTPFHLRLRKQQGITDIHTVGHRGNEAGIVMGITQGTPDRLRFTVKNQPIEKHDGLQIELADRDKPYGFPVDDIRIFPQRNNDTWKNAFTAPVDATIEVALPEGHPDIATGARLYCSSSQAVKRSYDWTMPRPALCKNRFPVYFELDVRPQQLTVISQPCAGPRELDDITTTINLDETLAPARNAERNNETIKTAFAKLGDTNFSLADLRIDNPDNLFIPSSILNDLRRRTTDDVQEALDNDLADITANVKKQLAAPLKLAVSAQATSARPKWIIKIDKPFFLNVFTPDDFEDVDEVIFSLARTSAEDLETALNDLERLVGSRNRIRLSIPPVIRRDTGYVTLGTLSELYRKGWRRWEISNIGSTTLLTEAGATLANLNLTADWSLFVTNTAAAQALLAQNLRRLVLSPDDTLQNWEDLLDRLADVVDVPVYQDTVLAISDVCAMNSLNGSCLGKQACRFTRLTLENPKRNERLIAINNACQTVIIHDQPFNLTGHIAELYHAGAQRFRADFCWQDYAPVTIRNIWRDLRCDKPSSDAWTANLLR